MIPAFICNTCKLQLVCIHTAIGFGLNTDGLKAHDVNARSNSPDPIEISNATGGGDVTLFLICPSPRNRCFPLFPLLKALHAFPASHVTFVPHCALQGSKSNLKRNTTSPIRLASSRLNFNSCQARPVRLSRGSCVSQCIKGGATNHFCFN